MQKKTKIFDTSWWISFIVSKKSFGFPTFFLDNRMRICFSEELKNEIISSLAYVRTFKRINPVNLELFNNYITYSAKIFTSKSVVVNCRDAKDNFLLALARDAKADFLITRDEDLLVLNQFENTLIVTLP
ncbi:MAG TPA: putative toxin-antitoxin system toxin component, PIN family [Chitinophagaceae bacterium]|jgi:hypothetical protein